MDTTLARFVAVVLIANSHLEPLYPARQLAADGLIGNALFFFMSGLGLELAARAKGRGERFAPWFRRRLSRIYPPLWIVAAVFVLAGGGAWRTWGAIDYVQNLIWPTPYGFVAQIVPFYAAFFVLARRGSPRTYLGAAGILAVAHAAVSVLAYDPHALSWLFYGVMMLLGGWAAARAEGFGRSPGRDAAVLAVFLTLYVGIKLAMSLGRLPNHATVLHILCMPIVWSILGLCAHPGATALVRSGRPAARLVAAVAGKTFEIYLIHEYVAFGPPARGLPFPLNLALFWPATFALALGPAWVAGRLRGIYRTSTASASDGREAVLAPGSIR